MQYQILFFIRVEIVVPISGIKYYLIGRIEVGEAISFNKRPYLIFLTSSCFVSLHLLSCLIIDCIQDTCLTVTECFLLPLSESLEPICVVWLSCVVSCQYLG